MNQGEKTVSRLGILEVGLFILSRMVLRFWPGMAGTVKLPREWVVTVSPRGNVVLGQAPGFVPAEPGFESQSFTSCLCDLWQVLKPQLLYLSNRVTLIVRICYPQRVLHKKGYAISLCLNAIQLWGVNKRWGKWREAPVLFGQNVTVPPS